MKSSEPLFDRSAEYEQMLDQGLRLSGERRDFFERGRLVALRSALAARAADAPGRILDFGCGFGGTSVALAREYPRAEVVGVDVSEPLLERARGMVAETEASRVAFARVDQLNAHGRFDLCYVSGVFHHIDPGQRPAALAAIVRALRPNGLFSFFENNPWNPGTRLVMSRIPFDRDAVTLSPRSARRLLCQHGFVIEQPVRSLFYFPRALALLRSLERPLAKLPLGAQYWILARPARG